MKKIQFLLAILCLNVACAQAQWLTTGNVGTVDGTNFLGTTDNVPLSFRVNNSKAGRIDNNPTTQTTALGFGSANSNTGNQNTAFGYHSMYTNTTGSFNTIIGTEAMNAGSSSYNTAVGVNALYFSNGGQNTAMGVNALFYTSTGINNTGIGFQNFQVNTTGSNNTALGAFADVLTSGLSNATALGYQAKVGASNSLVLGGTGTYAVNVGIGTTTPTARLELNNTTAGTSGLKFTQLTSASTPSAGTGTALGVDASGNVILVPVANVNGDIIVSTTMNLTSNWNLGGATLVFQGSGNLTGTATVSNGYIQANTYKTIIGPNITLSGIRPYGDYFSACWFGASPSVTDNSTALQQAINSSIANGAPLFIPALGNYSYSQPLSIANGASQVSNFHMYGGSQFWSSQTTLAYTGTGSTNALQIFCAKGVEINNLTITGKYVPPSTPDNTFFLTTFANYLDASGLCTDSYSGIVIDPTSSCGSTGVKIHDVFVSNFAVDFSISPGSSTNSDILLFENIHVGDSKVGFQSGYAQSKGDEIRGIYSWGRMHTLISIGNTGRGQAGFWNLDGANVAGDCIRLFNITVGGWYATKITDYYAENIGTIGYFTTNTANAYTAPPIYVQGCNFNLNYNTPQQSILTVSSYTLKFESCTFRYYNGTYPTALPYNYEIISPYTPPPTFSNCSFTGPMTLNTSIFSMY